MPALSRIAALSLTTKVWIGPDTSIILTLWPSRYDGHLCSFRPFGAAPSTVRCAVASPAPCESATTQQEARLRLRVSLPR